MDGRTRSNIKIGAQVDIVLKKNQGTGALTRGDVKSGKYGKSLKFQL